jgi:hypothetical protein
LGSYIEEINEMEQKQIEEMNEDLPFKKSS